MSNPPIEFLPTIVSDLQSTSTSDPDCFIKLNEFLRFHSTRFAKESPSSEPNSRLEFTILDSQSDFKLTESLSKLWSMNLDELTSDELKTEKGEQRLKLAISSLLLSRNIVAGSNQAQNAFFARVTSLLQLLHLASSFSSLNSETLQPLSRIATQLLANLITRNEPLQENLWKEITTSWRKISRDDSKPRLEQLKEDKFSDLFSRLLDSPDPGTLTATQVLLLSLTKGSYSRSLHLCSTLQGVRILSSFLTTADQTVEQDENEEFSEDQSDSNGETNQLSQRLGIIYPFFTNLFQKRLFSRMFRNLLTGLTGRGEDLKDEEKELWEIQGELGPTSLIVEQLTLLKLLDSWLHFRDNSEVYDGDGGEAKEGQDFSLLLEWFLKVSKIAGEIMEESIQFKSNPDFDEKGKIEENQRTFETRLESSHKVLVLTLQCLISICVSTEGSEAKIRFEESFKKKEGEEKEKEGEVEEESGFVKDGKELLKRLRSKESGVVEEVVALLKTTSKYSPPISPFKPFKTGPAPDSHSLSTTGLAPSVPLPQNSDVNFNALNSSASTSIPGALAYLKRDLVRLLGVLSYSPPKRYQHQNQDQLKQVKNVQDRVRELGGLFDVLNLTALDELNPYIREHAIFTLRNLLAGNEESQSLIAKLRPLESNENGSS